MSTNITATHLAARSVHRADAEASAAHLAVEVIEHTIAEGVHDDHYRRVGMALEVTQEMRAAKSAATERARRGLIRAAHALLDTDGEQAVRAVAEDLRIDGLHLEAHEIESVLL